MFLIFSQNYRKTQFTNILGAHCRPLPAKSFATNQIYIIILAEGFENFLVFRKWAQGIFTSHLYNSFVLLQHKLVVSSYLSIVLRINIL